MRYGRGAPGKGWLPVFSVGSGASLDAFGRRLEELHDRYLAGMERCECK